MVVYFNIEIIRNTLQAMSREPAPELETLSLGISISIGSITTTYYD